jgi:hypothetical protein
MYQSAWSSLMERREVEGTPAVLLGYCLVASSGFIVGTVVGWLIAAA